jgi:hypothetical protein
VEVDRRFRNAYCLHNESDHLRNSNLTSRYNYLKDSEQYGKSELGIKEVFLFL